MNRWNVEEAFQIVQAKLTGTAATWYQNKEKLFDGNPGGLDEGWTTFWHHFEQKYIAQDEQALWLQFESRVLQADETVETYAVVDTGASHSIVSFRIVRRLRLKSLMRPSKKAFITAAGELTFPVGEIAALPLTIGDSTIRANCMVVGKACFLLLLGLDVMKPVGAPLRFQIH